MCKACSWLNILIAVIIAAIIGVLGLFGALISLNSIYLVILALAVLSLALVVYYVLRREPIRIDLRCLVYTAFIAILASVLGIIIDVLTIFELPLLFIAVAAIVITLIADFCLIRYMIRRGGC